MFHESRLNAGYIKAGKLPGERIAAADMKPLALAFVGFNREQTLAHFRQFARDNAEQIWDRNLELGWILLYDGTVIKRITSMEQARRDGVRFDQIILADDRRRMIWKERAELIRFLDIYGCRCSEVPQEFRFQIYDVDAPEV